MSQVALVILAFLSQLFVNCLYQQFVMQLMLLLGIKFICVMIQPFKYNLLTQHNAILIHSYFFLQLLYSTMFPLLVLFLIAYYSQKMLRNKTSKDTHITEHEQHSHE